MSDYLGRLEAFADAWQSAMDDDLTSDVIAVIDGKPLRESDLRVAVDEVKQLRAEAAELAGERDGHQNRQVWAERVLIVLLAREGGAIEITPAEMVRADLDGSFVSSHDVATGNERLAFRAVETAAPQQPEPDGGTT